MRAERFSGDSSDDEEDLTSASRYATAETPLLGRDSPKEPRGLYQENVIILIFAFLFIAELGAGLWIAPSSMIMENIICRDYHPEVSDNIFANNPLCKGTDVQGTLATIRGWAFTFDCIPGILGAVPYGIMSDKWGRKPVFVLSIIGIVLSFAWVCMVLYLDNIFPLWTIWFGSVFQLIGGSSSVMGAMLYTMGADVVPVAGR